MKTVLKKAFSGQAHVDMNDVFDLTVALEGYGVDAETIDGIIEDFERSQMTGTQRAKDFMRDILRLYELKEGEILPELQRLFYEPAHS